MSPTGSYGAIDRAEQALNTSPGLFILSERPGGAREGAHHTGAMDRRLRGAIFGVAGVVALTAAMVPLREHLAISTAALVLLVPVVFGAMSGGFAAGLAVAVLGFLAFDVWFIPPYGTLEVGATQNWTALGVYLVVAALVARVVTRLDASRDDVRRGDESARRLLELSEILVGDRPVDELLRGIAEAAHVELNIPGVALLVLDEGRLRVAATAGEHFTEEFLASLSPGSGLPVAVGTRGAAAGPRSLALAASGRPAGLLVLSALPERPTDRAVLTTFANDAALALERARLREEALRSHLLEQIDRFRQGLLGAVSHDLRSPLATIKVASSTLAAEGATLPESGRVELYRLIEVEADRLNRLVANLLDLARIEAGVLSVQRTPVPVAQLVDDARRSLAPALEGRKVEVRLDAGLPEVLVDPVLLESVLVNLLDNAQRHSPPEGAIVVTARRVGDGDGDGDGVELAVADEGPGVPPAQREMIFHRFTRLDTAGRSGLGLAIARTFVEAHAERIWYEDAPGGGARFALSLPAATFLAEEA
jgi:two-component system sensor histidine kinase KdpD